MRCVRHGSGERAVAEIVSGGTPLSSAQDALELMHDPDLGGARAVILRRGHLAPAFFDLRTGLAGEIAQKFVTYGVRVAIVGDFSDLSPTFQAFVRESNRGRHLFFAKDETEGIEWLARA